MATGRARRAAGEVPDDLLLDVFARLTGLRDLVRCAATCKRWLRLVTDRAFLRRIGLWPDTAPRPSVLVGVFSQNAIACSWSAFERGQPRSSPKFLSLLAGDVDRHLTFGSFFPDDDGLFSFARPLASRRGLLLVRVLLPSSDCFDPVDQKFQLAVCRPVGGDKRSTHLLPPPAFDTIGFSDHDFTGYALLTNEDYGDAGNLDRQQQHTFQVVLNYTDRDGIASACTYSSATGSWSAPVKCRWPSALIRCGPRAGVVIHSIVHWLYMGKDKNFYTLNVNTATRHISLTKIPIKAPSNMRLFRPPIPCIAEEGMLSFVTMQQGHGVLELWTKQGEDSSNHDLGCEEGWQHSQLADLGSKTINIVFFAESRGALLVQQGGVFVTVDLKSKETMVVDLKDDKVRHIKGTSRDSESCSSTCCDGRHYGGRKCTPTPPVHVLYELDWVFSRNMFLTSSTLGDKM